MLGRLNQKRQNHTESVCAKPLFVIPACETKIWAKNSNILCLWLVEIGYHMGHVDGSMCPTCPSGSVSRKLSFSPVIRMTIFGPLSQICFKWNSSLLFPRTQCISPLFQETWSYPLSQPIWMSIPSGGWNQWLNLTEAWHTLSGQQSWLSFAWQLTV